MSMSVTRLSPGYSTSPQISREDVAGIAAEGYRSIMCNRPDGEGPGQTAAEEIRAEAESNGLAFAYVPVVSGAITEENVAAFRAALDHLPGPVLAYCRSGTRCQNLWTLSGY
jgi:sulfide:quinone oxidoreductase